MNASAPRLSAARVLLGTFLLLALAATASAAEFGISADRRHLTLNNKPFLWLGDTVWLLAQLPSNDELELYLKTRAEQGFTVIQLAAVMAEERVWGTLRKTARGDLPFTDGDVSRPAVTEGRDPNDPAAYDYWDHLDYVLERIHAHGLHAALVTDFVGWQGDGYKYLTPPKAYGYGKFLGQRLAGKPEIIWILGGDNTPNNDDKKAVWHDVAKGIVEGLCGTEDYSRALMTYHINGGASSSQIFHDARWLDFNMTQTWSEYRNIPGAVRRDYEKQPPKPCGLGEGAYEDGLQYPTKPIDALVIRQQANRSYFAGGYHTYGSGNVWHFDSVKNESTQPWKEAVRSPGAESLRHTRTFLESIEWWNCVPDSARVLEGQPAGEPQNLVLRNAQTGALALYLGKPAAIKLNLDCLPPGLCRVRWVNPATGEERPHPSPSDRTQPFQPPAGWTDAFLDIAPARALPE